MMRKIPWRLLILIPPCLLLRMVYGWDLPLSGDESVSLLQAAGKAVDYPNQIPQEPTKAGRLRTLMEYSPDYGIPKVLESMEKTGMHPPFYYLLVHLVLRWGNSSALLFRLISILFSTTSVFLLFRIGKDIRDEQTGWIAAGMLALSAYGIQCGIMVRPYPLLMFLSLLSTWIMLQAEKQSDSRKFVLMLGLYTLTVVIGLYTLYHFVFVFCFQGFYFLCLYRKNIRRLGWIAAACIAIGILYLPWIPSFRSQLDVMQGGTYYFHNTSHPLKFLATIYDELFARHLFEKYSPVWMIFFFLVAPAAFIGLWKGLFSSRMRWILTGLLGCIAVNLLADWKMNSHTLATAKLLFFVLPMGLVVLASGLVTCWTAGIRGKVYASAVAALLCIHSLAGFTAPQTIDGPHSLNTFPELIAPLTQFEKPTLVVINKNNCRFVLSLVHAAWFPCDVLTMEAAPPQERTFALPGTDVYSSLAVIYFSDVTDETPLQNEQKESLIQQAEQAGFEVIQTAAYRSGKYEDRLLLFTRKRTEGAVFLLPREKDRRT